MIYTVTLNPTIDRTMRFPRLVIGALNRATSSRCDLSGKGVNVSVVLRRLGVESVVMGLAGGLAGRVLMEGLRAQGHRCDFVEVAGETRSNVTVIDEATGVTTKLNEPGPTVTEADLQALEERLLGRLQPGDVCVFSGSLPPGAPEETYARFITQVHRRGGLAVLDTSDQALAAGCAARPEWIKPNQVEAEALIGRPLAAEGALVQDLRALLALGAQRVLLSLGSRGAAYADGTTMWLAEPPPIVEVSAVGAGDALLAAALWAWQRGLGAKEIVRWAVACGTAAALEDGTAMPSWERVQEMYGGVQVRPLNSGSGA